MLELLGPRQKELLTLLLKAKAGLTVDELAGSLKITRNAVRQHLLGLENEGLVTPGATRPSGGGRPQQLYVLADRGKEVFPRQYSWLAQLVIESVTQEAGATGLRERMGKVGSKMAERLRTRNPGLKSRQEKVKKLSELMEELGYNTGNVATTGSAPVIEADNCVFHELAVRNPEVCEFDLALLSGFTDSRVDHEECMARGGNVCRFRFRPKG